MKGIGRRGFLRLSAGASGSLLVAAARPAPMAGPLAAVANAPERKLFLLVDWYHVKKGQLKVVLDPAKITVIETGVDVEYFRPSVAPEATNSMVFTGSMDWLPNEDGIFYFAEQILPLVRKQIPEASQRAKSPSP